MRAVWPSVSFWLRSILRSVKRKEVEKEKEIEMRE
jgi:hypothetical protein